MAQEADAFGKDAAWLVSMDGWHILARYQRSVFRNDSNCRFDGALAPGVAHHARRHRLFREPPGWLRVGYESDRPRSRNAKGHGCDRHPADDGRVGHDRVGCRRHIVGAGHLEEIVSASW